MWQLSLVCISSGEIQCLAYPIFQWRVQGRGAEGPRPPVIFETKLRPEGPFGDPPTLSKGLDESPLPSPLSQGLDPALFPTTLTFKIGL